MLYDLRIPIKSQSDSPQYRWTRADEYHFFLDSISLRYFLSYSSLPSMFYCGSTLFCPERLRFTTRKWGLPSPARKALLFHHWADWIRRKFSIRTCYSSFRIAITIQLSKDLWKWFVWKKATRWHLSIKDWVQLFIINLHFEAKTQLKVSTLKNRTQETLRFRTQWTNIDSHTCPTSKIWFLTQNRQCNLEW